eukprot:gene26362-29782_t
MSFAIFKEFDKDAADIFSEDFDSKFSLKVKSAGPCSSTLTTNIEVVDKEGKQSLKPKVTLKYPHASGFTLEKLEFTNDLKLTVETSLVNTVPGLKLEFKGNDSDKADLSFKYVHPSATVTGEFDVNSLAKADASVSAGHGAFTGGVSAQFVGGKDDGKVPHKLTFGLGVAHTVPNVCFTAVRAKDNFSAASLLFSYSSVADLVLAGQVDYNPKKTVGAAAAAYKIDRATTLKVKGNSEGIVAASLKKNFDKKFTVVGSVEVPHTLKSVKWGVNATLG